MSVLTETGVYEFQTSALKGAIRAGHALPHHGVTQLRHKQTGAEFAHPDWSMLNIFRIMGSNPDNDRGMGGDLGQPRSEEHEIEVSDDALTLHWPPTADRRASVSLKYEVGEDNIDVTVSVRAEACYNRFDVLLSSYNNPEVHPHVFLARDKFELTDVPGRFEDKPELIRVTMHPSTRGGVLIFPRDAAAARIFTDGRWDAVARFSPVRRYRASADVPSRRLRAGRRRSGSRRSFCRRGLDDLPRNMLRHRDRLRQPRPHRPVHVQQPVVSLTVRPRRPGRRRALGKNPALHR